jgi:hypothetical protein
MGLENKVEPLKQVSSLINCLSNDEDVRQDLWVSYLSGTSVKSLNARLLQINAEYKFEREFQEALWNLINNPPSQKLSDLVQEHFTDYERSLIFFLMLGFDAGKISEIKGISQVRIKQSLATIRYNKCWEEAYGIKEKPDRRREVRT